MNPEKLFPEAARLDLPLVDLATGPFWGVFLSALVLLPLIREGRLRQAVLAVLNLSFLTLLYPPGLPYIVAAVAAFWLLLRHTANRSLVWLTTFTALALFVLHKRPDWSLEVGLGGLNPVLAAVAFSYVFLRAAEVFRAVCEQRHPCPTPVLLVNYLFPFNMIAAGPIQSYDEFCAAPEVPDPLNPNQVMEGLERLSTGLFKKFVLAQALNTVFLTGFRNADPFWLALEIQFFYLWLYLDFSGYADVAVGVGRMVGISTPENFDRPLRSRNIFDFWKRWHMTLSRFIRINIFFPIQLALLRANMDRSPLQAALISWFTAFTLGGLWHALNWGFFFWGVLHGLGLVVCKLYEILLLRRWGRKGLKVYLAHPGIRIVAVLVTFEFVAFVTALPFIPWLWMWGQWTGS